MVREQDETGRDDVVRQLHARYHRGELTFRAIAAELRLSMRELYELFEQKELPTQSAIALVGSMMAPEAATLHLPDGLAQALKPANEDFLVKVIERDLQLARHAYVRGMEPPFSGEPLAEELC